MEIEFQISFYATKVAKLLYAIAKMSGLYYIEPDNFASAYYICNKKAYLGSYFDRKSI